MKKYLLALLFALIIVAPVSAYTVKKGDTPWKLWGSAWKENITQCGVTDPRKLPIGCEINSEQKLGIASLDVVALYEDNLQNSIASSDTSMTLIRGTDQSGTGLSGTFGFIIDEGTTIQEFVIATCSSTACTSMLRGISVTDGKTEVSALKKAHRKGATVKMTNYPILGRINRQLNGQDSIDNLPHITTSTNIPTSSGQLATKYYVDQVGAGGFTASNVSTTEGTRALGTSPEKVGVYVRADKGMVTSTTGIYQNVDTTTGLTQGASGVGLSTSTLVSLIATSTPTAGKILMTSAASTTINSGWIDGSTLTNIPIYYAVGNASAVLQTSADTQRNTTTLTYAKIKEIQATIGGTLRISFDLSCWSSCNGNTVYARIYKNGAAVGTERSNNTQSTAFVTYTEDLVFYPGDLIQLYFKASNGSSPVYIQNFRTYFTITTTTASGIAALN